MRKNKSPVSKAFSLVIRIESDLLTIRKKLRQYNCPVLVARHGALLIRKEKIVTKHLN